MINKGEFQREFFDILIETKGFFVEEIGDENNSLWIATKTLENGSMHSIIISDRNNKEKNNNRAYNYLKNRGGEFSLSNIIVFNKKIQDKSIKSKKSNEILVDLHSKKVYGYNENNKILIEIIDNIFQNKYVEKDKYYKTIGINEFTKYIIFILIATVAIVFLIIMVVEKNNITVFLSRDPVVVKDTISRNVFLFVSSGKFYNIIKNILLHDGVISLIVNLYVLYILVGIIDLFENKSKFIIVYLTSAFLAGMFNLFFIPYMSLTISITGAILGVLGLTLLLAVKERKVLGNWLLVNILIIICIDFVMGISSSYNYYISHCIDLSIGFLIGVILYKSNYLKNHFYNF